MLRRSADAAGLALLNLLEPRGRAEVRRGLAYGSDPRQVLDVYRPQRARAAPIVVFLHGGGWRRGSRSAHRFVGKGLAALGFVAVIPDYRLFPAVRFPAFIQDAAAAVAWARANAATYGADRARLFLMGFSAGAHAATAVAVEPLYLAPHGLVSRDLAGVVALAGPHDLRHEDMPRYHPIFANAGDAARPARLVRRAPPPLLLMHGAADRTVDIEHSRTLAAVARRAGGRVVLREYPRVGHAGLLLSLSHRFRRRTSALRDLAAFVAEGEPPPEPRFAAAR